MELTFTRKGCGSCILITSYVSHFISVVWHSALEQETDNSPPFCIHSIKYRSRIENPNMTPRIKIESNCGLKIHTPS